MDAQSADATIQFLARVQESTFPCLGAKAAERRGQVFASTHHNLHEDPKSLADLGSYLHSFVAKFSNPRSDFAVHVAIDLGASLDDEEDYERFLWAVLQKLHQIDSCDWDPQYSREPDDPSFKFSFAGRAFYVVGLSPVASREARRFPHPSIVFNPVWQFERLRDLGQLDHLIAAIRRRDIELQGNLNPNLEFEGVRSDALQYSGRSVGRDWVCPIPEW